MWVAVCEDKKADRKRLVSCLEEEFSRRKLSVEVVVYENGEGLLSAVGKIPFQIYFLDIYMSGISGMAVAKTLCEKGKDAAIVFTTSSKDHLSEGFVVNAVHYLVKPYLEAEVCEVLDRCLRQIGEMERY